MLSSSRGGISASFGHEIGEVGSVFGLYLHLIADVQLLRPKLAQEFVQVMPTCLAIPAPALCLPTCVSERRSASATARAASTVKPPGKPRGA